MPHVITVSQNRSINVINHVNTVKKKNTVLMLCPWQFQKIYFTSTFLRYLSLSKQMSLNDVASP